MVIFSEHLKQLSVTSMMNTHAIFCQLIKPSEHWTR